MCIRDSLLGAALFRGGQTKTPPSYDGGALAFGVWRLPYCCLLYTSDAADERSSVDLGGRRIIKKKKTTKSTSDAAHSITQLER